MAYKKHKDYREKQRKLNKKSMGNSSSSDDSIQKLFDQMQRTYSFSVSSAGTQQSSSTNNKQSIMKFKVGDKVKILDFSSSSESPSWARGMDQYVGQIATVREIRMNVGSSGGYVLVELNENSWSWNEKWLELADTKPKVIKFDLKELDALIIEDQVREEIEAVLKQHKNGSKIFDDWGLGETIEYGKGMTFLFYGPPGTGKTWGAHCIGKVVGQELLTIGAAEIQSQEPGAANRNIQDAFKAAKEEGKILFIDECDSLITNRSDVGMILGGEINTLLTEIEKAEGIVILATNRIENLDEALERRIGLIVEFPEPNHGQRKAIFEKMLPKKMPLDKDVDPLKLADYKLTGGQIKNVILQAARLAMSAEEKKVGLKHFEAAIHRVHQSKSLMGSASRYEQRVIKTDLKRG